MVVRESTVLREKRESDFDKTMKIIQSHHLNDYNDCTVHDYAPGANFQKSNRWIVYQALYDGVSQIDAQNKNRRSRSHADNPLLYLSLHYL